MGVGGYYIIGNMLLTIAALPPDSAHQVFKIDNVAVSERFENFEFFFKYSLYFGFVSSEFI